MTKWVRLSSSAESVTKHLADQRHARQRCNPDPSDKRARHDFAEAAPGREMSVDDCVPDGAAGCMEAAGACAAPSEGAPASDGHISGGRASQLASQAFAAASEDDEAAVDQPLDSTGSGDSSLRDGTDAPPTRDEEDAVDADALLDAEEEQLLLEYEEAEQRLADEHELPDGALTWLDVAGAPVCELLASECQCTVRQAAFSIMHNMSKTSSTFDSASRSLDFVNCQLLGFSASPANSNNRLPPSRHVCQQIMGVQDISKYEVRVCPSHRGCLHWWTPTAHHVPDPSAHATSCKGCKLCRCSSCNTARYETANGRVRACLPVNLFPDVLQLFFYSREWYLVVNAARKAQDAPWYKTREHKRLKDALKNLVDLLLLRFLLLGHKVLLACSHRFNVHVLWSCSVDESVFCLLRVHIMRASQVLFFEVGVDGVKLRQFTTHSCQLWVTRFRNAAVDMLAKVGNCKVIMAIPGPKQPQARQWPAFCALVFSVFGFGATETRAPPVSVRFAQHRTLCLCMELAEGLQSASTCSCTCTANAKLTS